MAREHLNTEENRELLARAIEARAAYWDASRALEKALGLEDVPDCLDSELQDEIATYAVDVDDPTSSNHFLREPEVLQGVLDLEGWNEVDDPSPVSKWASQND
jgi:hypothetical protein